MTDPFAVVVDFVKRKKLLCYGGQAINNLLPPEARFYGPDEDPDYDCFSTTPQLEAIHLVDALTDAGFTARASCGLHLETFRVYILREHEPQKVVCDLTHVAESVFERLWADRVVQDGIAYANPNFLRMAIYLELSRPKGYVERWEKIYPRLLLLNKYWPPGDPDPAAAKTGTAPIPPEIWRQISDLLIATGSVLLGVSAVATHAKRRGPIDWQFPVDILTTKRVRILEPLVRILGGAKVVRAKKSSRTDLLPSYVELSVDGRVQARIYDPNACHSYHETSSGVRIASLPTLLHFYFGSLYLGDHHRPHVLALAQALVEMAHREAPPRRYKILTPSTCIGTQPQRDDLQERRKEMMAIYGDRKFSGEYLKYFFFYDPRRMTPEAKHSLVHRLKKLY